MTPLLLALQFLTRLPVPQPRTCDERAQGRSLLFYPLVGLLIGALLVALPLSLDLPIGVMAALVLAAWVLITGALHLDGLADSADAWVGGHGDRERTLTIMKDPRSGPMGVTALVLLLLLKFTALQALLAEGTWWPLLLAPVLGRAVIPLLFLTTDYVRPGGLGAALTAHFSRAGAMGVVGASGALAIVLAGMDGVRMVAAAALCFLLLRALMQRRLGGTTGDTAGALVEFTEAAVLIAGLP